MDLNSIREFNKLFEAINHDGTPSYFSGKRFIGIIREFDPNFADYGQYIAYRQEKGLNMSRKNYFYDILMQYKEGRRKQIIERMWEEVNSSNLQTAEQRAETVILFEDLPAVEQQEPKVTTEDIENPKVFISYSWDKEEHKNWVLELAEKLINNGVDVILDRYDLGPGKNMHHFMDEAIKEADKVLIVFTPDYKQKAEKREGGVGYEYAILNVDLYKKIASNNKYLPILREGTRETAIPDFMQQFITVQMTDNSNFDEKFNELLLAIYNKPQIDKPKIGKCPDFIYP